MQIFFFLKEWGLVANSGKVNKAGVGRGELGGGGGNALEGGGKEWEVSNARPQEMTPIRLRIKLETFARLQHLFVNFLIRNCN